LGLEKLNYRAPVLLPSSIFFGVTNKKKIFILSFFGQACVYQTNPPSRWQPLFLTIFLSSAMQGSCWKGLAS
jgi:hypothetical protein